MTLWKASSDDVWYRAESLLTKQRASHLLLNLKEHKQQQKKQDVMCVVISEHAMSCYSHLHLFNHFFSCPDPLTCHVQNFLFLCLCLL